MKDQQDLETLRSLDLAGVLTRMGWIETADSRPQYRTRKFKRDGHHGSIAVTEKVWIDNAANSGGRGAIDLVMYLSGCDLKTALSILVGHSASTATGTNHRSFSYRQRTLAGSVAAILEPVPETWKRARRYLIDIRKIPARLVDHCHSVGLVFSDERANLIFKREGGGFFKRGSFDPHDRPAFKQTVGQAAGPFILTGDEGKVIIAEGPVDALSLKTLYPIHAVLATGGNFPPIRLKHYIGNPLEILLAHDADCAGDVQAERIRTALEPITPARFSRLRPVNGKDWNEVLRLAAGRGGEG